MNKQTNASPSHIREDDMQTHIEDSLTVNAIRDGLLIDVPWNELTDEERRAAYVTTFHIYEVERKRT
ncbi:MAG: hypothetical protein JO031_13185 [Ktedonobacteraceae bacterium]|nr:hypothetical protein [Ktedonobacteraceae bacterium]